MRRLATWVAVVVLTGTAGTALASTATADVSRPGSFCSSARSVADQYEDFDPTSLTDREFRTRVERVFKKLAKQAPSSLESAFARINAFYRSLADADTNRPEADEAYIEQATKASKALKKVFKYLSSKCHLAVG